MKIVEPAYRGQSTL